MESYEVFSTVSRSEQWGPKSFPPASNLIGPYNAAPLPAQVVGSYEPYSITSWVVPSPKPVPSWDAVKRSGAIRMTPYEAERRETYRTLAGLEECNVRFYRPHDLNVSKYPATCAGIEFVELHHRWRQQGDVRYWLSRMSLQVLNRETDHDVDDVVASTQAAAIAAFKGGYDFLTEVAEVRQGLQFFKGSAASVFNLFSRFFAEHGDVVRKAMRRKKALTASDLLRSTDRAAQKAGNAWLAYRYAVMPLWYSYQDIKQLIQRSGNLYQSYRSQESVEIPRPSADGLSSGLYQTVQGSKTVTSVVKAGYSNDFLRTYVSNQVQWNPFATAWEMVPLSFVMDWFVNVGDFIIANTSSDYSAMSAGCTSVKTEVTIETFLRNKQAILYQQTWNALPPCLPSAVLRSYPFNTDTTETCETVVVEHIKRTPFDLNSAQLTLRPSMNWKRYVDSAALSHQMVKSLLRRFKK